MNILISACLVGVNCRYDGGTKIIEEFQELSQKYSLIPICPEQLGGLATPRLPAEIIGNQVMNSVGVDVTKEFQKGAEEVLKLAQRFNCSIAILKERSPSCGKGMRYDGSFLGKLTTGDGITAALLEENKITVYGESQIHNLL